MSIQNENKVLPPKTTPELERLLKKRSMLPRRVAFIALENLAVFSVPAFIALYFGLNFGYLIPLLLIALLLSWSIFYIRFRTITRELNELEKAIDAERTRAGIEKPVSPGWPEDDESSDDDEEGDDLQSKR